MDAQLAAVDGLLNSEVAVGAFFGYGAGDIDMDRADSEADVDGYSVGTYASYAPGPMFFDSILQVWR